MKAILHSFSIFDRRIKTDQYENISIILVFACKLHQWNVFLWR